MERVQRVRVCDETGWSLTVAKSAAMKMGSRIGALAGGHWLSWSLPVLTVCGTSVRLHVGFLVWGVLEISMALTRGGVGLLPALAAVYGVLGVVMVREVLRAVVLATCDRSELVTDRFAIMWPGAAVIRPCTPTNGLAARHARVRTAVAGLASGGVVVGVMSGLVLLAGGTPEVLWFDVLNPAESVARFGITQGWLFWAWWLYAMSVVCFAVNLLPLLPLDGGVLGAEAVRRWSGNAEWHHRAMLVGVVVVVGGLAVATDSTRLVALVGVAGLWTLWESGKAPTDGPRAEVFAMGIELGDDGLGSDRRASSGVDALLARLRSRGVAGLTAAEVAELDQVAAELRDRLECAAGEPAEPTDDVSGQQMPIP